MIYCYLRVSTDEQDVINQKQGIIKYLEYMDWTCDEWVIEQGVSGKVDYKKRLLGNLMKKLNRGDWIIVSELSRLSRSMINTFELVKELSAKGVSVYCVKESLRITDDALGLMILSAFAFASQIERERISQRTKETLDRKRKEGIKLGRPFGRAHKMLQMDNTREYIISCVDNGDSIGVIAKKVNVSKNTIKKWLINNDIYTPRLEYFQNKKKGIIEPKREIKSRKVIMLGCE